MEHNRSELESTRERKWLRDKRLGWRFLLRPSVWKTIVTIGIIICRALKLISEIWSPKD